MDPATDDFSLAPAAARRLHDLPDGLGPPSVVMITGSRGLRVLVPLDRRIPFDDVRAFARPLAAPLARADADDRELTTRRPSPDAIEDLLKGDPWPDFPWRGRSHGPARRRLAAPHA
ncbi:non-homologous end-joining DNA ligase LigD [Streptomyces lateritius]